MPWTVLYHDEFVPELEALPEDVQDALSASAALLETYGPALGRPHADTRAAFAFDLDRHAILLVAGDKAGVAQRRFYKALISRADKRFDAHLATLKEV